MKGNFINIITKKIKNNKNICFIMSLFVFIFSNYNCPEYYVFFREDYSLPPEFMSRSGERFFVFDSCRDLRPTWICFTGYF